MMLQHIQVVMTVIILLAMKIRLKRIQKFMQQIFLEVIKRIRKK